MEKAGEKASEFLALYFLSAENITNKTWFLDDSEWNVSASPGTELYDLFGLSEGVVLSGETLEKVTIHKRKSRKEITKGIYTEIGKGRRVGKTCGTNHLLFFWNAWRKGKEANAEAEMRMRRWHFTKIGYYTKTMEMSVLIKTPQPESDHLFYDLWLPISKRNSPKMESEKDQPNFIL